jgi:hypothetical protein
MVASMDAAIDRIAERPEVIETDSIVVRWVRQSAAG